MCVCVCVCVCVCDINVLFTVMSHYPFHAISKRDLPVHYLSKRDLPVHYLSKRDLPVHYLSRHQRVIDDRFTIKVSLTLLPSMRNLSVIHYYSPYTKHPTPHT